MSDNEKHQGQMGEQFVVGDSTILTKKLSVPLLKDSTVNEVRTRVLSAIVLIAFALGSVLWGGLPFIIFWSLVSLIALYEWLLMIGVENKIYMTLCGSLFILFPAYTYFVRMISMPEGTFFIENVANRMNEPAPYIQVVSSLMAVAAFGYCILSLKEPKKIFYWPLLGLVYCVSFFAAIYFIRGTSSSGMLIVIWIFAIVWSTDSGAYFIGRKFGGPKLWPRVSPKKTWSGFFGGVFFGTLAGVLAFYFIRFIDINTYNVFSRFFQRMFFVSFLSSILCQIGDLAESALKRHFNVKDSGSFIPGHGGVLDRIDGLWAVVVFISILRFF